MGGVALQVALVPLEALVLVVILLARHDADNLPANRICVRAANEPSRSFTVPREGPMDVDA